MAYEIDVNKLTHHNQMCDADRIRINQDYKSLVPCLCSFATSPAMPFATTVNHR
ncbi:hypothetical protein CCACVL1_07871 [Corchorus capsularis]|uniref:Uncharacterized protein n=1 Tax=Corchorus capsularis TaxID=210143 RepID=A0A1R3J3F4_COCAP|nr:hypothetical protein CCACVL1_07871 [Corchorus capsularis]